MHNVCRLCLRVSAQGLTPLHQSDRLIRKIQTYLRITINYSKSESLLPNNVCKECVSKLDAIHEFGAAARRVQRTLRKLRFDGADSLENFYIQLGGECGTVSGKEKSLQPVTIKIELETDKIVPNQTEKVPSKTETVPSKTKTVPSITESETELYKTKNYEKDCKTSTFEIFNKKETNVIVTNDNQHHKSESDVTGLSVKESLKMGLLEKGRCETRLPETVICETVTYEECNNYSSDDNVTLSTLQLKHIPFKTKVGPKEKKRKRTKYKAEIKTKGTVFKNSDITLFPAGTPEEDKKWQCLTCLVYVESRKALISHYNCSHNTTSNDKDDYSKQYRVERDADSGEICVCAHCGKRVQRRALKRHLRSHQTARPFVCSLCGRSYKSASDIVLHGRAHNGFKTLSCSYESCTYSTVYLGALKAHHNTHAPRYKFRCEKCAAGFNVRSWFEQHANFHSGEQPFHCTICPKKFHCSRYLTSHLTQVHGRSRVGTFHPCDECSARLPSRRRLRVHMRVEHASAPLFLCDACGRAFHKREYLELHRRVHTGDKPYPCSTCGKAFTKKCNLTQHERIHTGVQPYQCSQCGRAFTQRSTFIRHIQCHADKYPYLCKSCSKSFVTRAQLTVHRRTCSPADASSPSRTAGGVVEC